MTVRISLAPASAFSLVISYHPVFSWNCFPVPSEIDSIVTVLCLCLCRWWVWARQEYLLKDEVQVYTARLNLVWSYWVGRLTRRMIEREWLEMEIVDGKVNLSAPFISLSRIGWYRRQSISWEDVVCGDFNGPRSWQIICNWTWWEMREHRLDDLSVKLRVHRGRMYFDHGGSYLTAALWHPLTGVGASRIRASGSICSSSKVAIWEYSDNDDGYEYCSCQLSIYSIVAVYLHSLQSSWFLGREAWSIPTSKDASPELLCPNRKPWEVGMNVKNSNPCRSDSVSITQDATNWSFARNNSNIPIRENATRNIVLFTTHSGSHEYAFCTLWNYLNMLDAWNSSACILGLKQRHIAVAFFLD